MNLFKFVDLTLLKPEASTEDIDSLVKTALEYKVAGVCVHPHFVEYVADKLRNSSVKVVTVVGFPLGMNTLETKVQETKNAIKNGAQEIDMVINHNHILEKNYHLLANEVKKIYSICTRHEVLLKVIVETSRLNISQKEMVCKFILKNADYIKTSTGFTEAGATIEDVSLFKTICADKMKIKASGGIRDINQFKNLIKAGASRIGTSSIAYLLDPKKTNTSY